jgi:hypothetical protein
VAADPTDRPRAGQPDGDVRRILVVANETIRGRALIAEVTRRTQDGRTVVKVVAPALIKSRFKHGLGDVDPAIDAARRRLDESLAALTRNGVDASGEVGDSDPNLAIADALSIFPADEVIISTHPPDRSAWLEKGVVDRAREELGIPITHVVVDLEAEGGATDIEQVEPARGANDERSAGGTEQTTAYMPPLPMRDRLTLLVGIVGTIALGVLAIICPEEADGSISGGCAARILIAIGAFMVTVWHGVALIFFRAVRYRGPWAAFAANTVLFGLPVAIVISLILG